MLGAQASIRRMNRGPGRRRRERIAGGGEIGVPTVTDQIFFAVSGSECQTGVCSWDRVGGLVGGGGKGERWFGYSSRLGGRGQKISMEGGSGQSLDYIRGVEAQGPGEAFDTCRCSNIWC